MSRGRPQLFDRVVDLSEHTDPDYAEKYQKPPPPILTDEAIAKQKSILLRKLAATKDKPERRKIARDLWNLEHQ